MARDLATLREHGITHIINCNAFVIPNHFENVLTYKSLWLQDSPGEDVTRVLYDCFDFIRAARGYDLPRWKLVYVYALRNAMLPVLTTIGFVFSFLISANVVIEKVFSWPGIGSYALEALVASDYAAVQGFVLAVATLYVLINIAIDILYGIVDVRVRLGD